MAVAHLHKTLQLGEQDVVEVELDTDAFVYFLDYANYAGFLADGPYDYYGTEVRSYPFRMQPPYPGIWELVIFPTAEGAALNARVSIVPLGKG